MDVLTLRTEVMAKAYLRTWQADGLFAAVVYRGDADRGGLFVKISHLNGRAVLFERARNFEGHTVWRQHSPDDGDDEREIDQKMVKKRSFDCDLWLLEVEDPQRQLVLDAPIETF